MSDNMNEELQWRIKAFFEYWRRRYKFISDLDFNEHHHEANVLLWGGFDALSNLWAENIGKQQCNSKGKRLIFDAFLAQYGGEYFKIVSLPHVWERIDKKDICIDKKQKRKLPNEICTFFGKIGERRTPTFLDEHQIRHTSDDWSLDAIITEALQICPSKINHAELKKWLIYSRYGAIAYKEMRSAYIHKGRPGKGTHSFNLSESERRPTYLTGIYTTPPSIGFSVEFMLDVLKCCINEFEDNALALQQDPAPEK